MMRDGYVSIGGYKTYYKVYGENNKATPLLVLHGGPGATHHYLLELQKLADRRPVIFYDQFGCGKSDGQEAEELWEIPTFINQLDSLVENLGLDKFNLLGHSWGGMLAIEYALQNPNNIQKIILSSTMISIPLYQDEVEKLVQKLPMPIPLILKKHHLAGTIDSTEYRKAYEVYLSTHNFRGKSWPKELTPPKGEFNTVQYRHMWGYSEVYTKTGTLKDWNRINDLHKITLPCLITAGEYDELTPKQANLTHEKLPDSTLKTFDGASHNHHVEKEDEYLSSINNFLSKT